MRQGIRQHYLKIGNSSAMSIDMVYVIKVSNLGAFQQCIMTEYTSALFQDWEQLSKVKRQVVRHQDLKIGSFSAIYYERVHIGNVLLLGTAQQCNKTRYTSTKIQDWELFSNVLWQRIHRQSSKIVKSSAT